MQVAGYISNGMPVQPSDLRNKAQLHNMLNRLPDTYADGKPWYPLVPYAPQIMFDYHGDFNGTGGKWIKADDPTTAFYGKRYLDPDATLIPARDTLVWLSDVVDDGRSICTTAGACEPKINGPRPWRELLFDRDSVITYCLEHRKYTPTSDNFDGACFFKYQDEFPNDDGSHTVWNFAFYGAKSPNVHSLCGQFQPGTQMCVPGHERLYIQQMLEVNPKHVGKITAYQGDAAWKQAATNVMQNTYYHFTIRSAIFHASDYTTVFRAGAPGGKDCYAWVRQAYLPDSYDGSYGPARFVVRVKDKYHPVDFTAGYLQWLIQHQDQIDMVPMHVECHA